MNEVILSKQRKQVDISLAVSTALTQLGVSSGELSYAKAVTIYGSWFTAAVKKGLLAPVRMGEGAKSKKYFSVTDILALKSAELEMAEIVLKG